MERKVSTVALHASSAEMLRSFERGEVSVGHQRAGIGILTKMDLIEMIARKTQIV